MSTVFRWAVRRARAATEPNLTSELRQTEMLLVLQSAPSMRVTDMAGHFGVSPSSVRRDLAQLAARGLVRRVHGGAMLANQVPRGPSFDLRQVSNRAEKEAVAAIAAGLVQDGMTIFIDGGTTTPFLVPHLEARQGLTVVTVGLNVIAALAAHPHITSIVLGGELHLETQTFAGPLAIEAQRSFGLTFDQAFISASGVSARFGVTNHILDRVAQKRMAIEASLRTVIVADRTKIGANAIGRVVTLDRVHDLVTNENAQKTELDLIAELGVNVILAPAVAGNPGTPAAGT
jgi:DeoR/GlpR family transcriptional regulator of sugar metabolism